MFTPVSLIVFAKVCYKSITCFVYSDKIPQPCKRFLSEKVWNFQGKGITSIKLVSIVIHKFLWANFIQKI